MVGYIGPNGAGKSSTIKIMSGILNPDSGACRIDGLVPWKERRAHVRNIGVVFGQRSQLWWDVPVIDSFELIRTSTKWSRPITGGTWTSFVTLFKPRRNHPHARAPAQFRTAYALRNRGVTAAQSQDSFS